MRNFFVLLTLALAISSCSNNNSNKNIALDGTWEVKLDSLNEGINRMWHNSSFNQTITLPGTTDAAQLGAKNNLKPELKTPQLLRLTRNYSYTGAAWYTRTIEIPQDMDNQEIILTLERVIWSTEVYIDGNKVEGIGESLTTPHRFNLTNYVKAGASHRLTICVDNSRRYDISVGDRMLGHAYTNETQIAWNGILGDITLSANNKISIKDSRVIPNIEDKSIDVWVITSNNSDSISQCELTIQAASKSKDFEFKELTKDVNIRKGVDTIKLNYKLGDKVVLWDEFTPQIYTLSSSIKNEHFKEIHTTDFGVRKIASNGSRMEINGRPLFLRGTLECCIFPLTGTPPTDHKGWANVFNSAKEWGLNHLRFHSWCPPKAAFEVADSMGFYLQVELPIWSINIKEEDSTTQFIREEGERILSEYGNHPSFCFLALGNELQSNFDLLEDILLNLKSNDPRHLYTTTSFTFEKGHGSSPEPNDDFFVTQWTKNGWVRGQGVFNSNPPSFDKDFNSQVAGIEVPLITHEIGQYSVYPNLKEIEKYRGVLTPLNFMAIRNDLKEKGLIDKATQYTEASGKLAALLYKEEIERAMKTSGISGYQLLDLHDFPGQGTALVGLLDAFWDSKGVETSEHFRQFASPVVPLVRFAKATYKNNETFTANIEVSNYSAKALNNKSIKWQLEVDENIIAQGTINNKDIKLGYNSNIGEIEIPLSKIEDATMANLVVKIDNTNYINNWNIWIYPNDLTINYGDVKYTRSLSEAKKLLSYGEKVLLNPDWRGMEGIEGKFLPVFWSPVHFPKQAATMGVLVDPKHPALENFPTQMHSNWQWWDLTINSKTMIIDSLDGVMPIVEQVDNFVNNRRLSSLFEAAIGNGQLVVASFDLKNDLDKRPVAKQMLYSILEYMNSSKFTPKIANNISALDKIIDVKELSNKKESATSIY